MISNAKFEAEKFDGMNNFGMWQCEVQDVLFQQELDIALEDELEEYTHNEWDHINSKRHWEKDCPKLNEKEKKNPKAAFVMIWSWHCWDRRLWFSSIKMLVGEESQLVEYFRVQGLSCNDRRWSFEGYEGCFDCDEDYTIEKSIFFAKEYSDRWSSITVILG
ncbi:hypothetical protein Acr_06g0000170 [Actinidia rufa]|uniref:Uncharacterized protein n=1 Tax=Actinidia rufa TaxID=165716 RepID=A0A7J0ER77_9ERIC|nr:hypothetical protein Acr_06g0000170 [Actinidia rufa]